ncbi:HicB family protein [Azospirillum melinis]|uniref:HicB family protein n=1 Tax=Azospirillum melinis TaxID=328839 RepID=A0ABX2KP00_9PROT|nr:type II toxin-antitoxin system HicB family antitoxin [Azospirillum melinis]MBP2310456.1 putative RNase H-like HicB family nuclease [Azospirillum melinis]NUB04431.1 HicB family protein [Azospirillum melinis]
MRYIALIDGEAGAYGVTIPDLPGCTAMGATVEEALAAAVDAMRDWAEVVEEDGGAIPAPRPAGALRADPDVAEALAEGAMLATVAMVRVSGRPTKANLSLDSGVLATLDAEAKRAGLTRSAMVEAMTKRLAAGNL